MARFNTGTVATAVRSPIANGSQPAGANFYGAPGYAREPKGELFLLAVANMVGKKAFYETAGSRDARFEELVRQVAVSDPAWMAAFTGWLRGEGNMRTASLVCALESAKAMIAAKVPGSRAIVAAALQRADEPGEAVAYWLSRYGRAIPSAVKRGIAEAVWRLYTERSLLKYDSADKAVRFGDVIALVHPTGMLADLAHRFPIKGTWRGDLYQYALDRRHNRDNPIPESLRMIHARKAMAAVDVAGRATFADQQLLRAAGMTWEALAGWRQTKMDRAGWEAAIPNMNYMALLKNLRNFDQAGVSDAVAARVIAKLTDPSEVAATRQFPFRFLSAYRHVESLRWAYPLEQALNLSLSNVPVLKGRTLVLVDQSPSMFPGYHFSTRNDSDISLADQAKLFGTAVAVRAEHADLVGYGGTSQLITYSKTESTLKIIERFMQIGSTNTPAAAARWYAGHDRVIIITDEQTGGDLSAVLPFTVPVYTWNVGGYQLGHSAHRPQWHTFGGLTDAAFRLIPLMESGRNGDWPWLIKKPEPVLAG